MSFLKMLLAFAPWLAFLFIAHGSLFRLKVGLVVAALLSVVMAVTKMHRGVIMWVGLVFFSYAIVAVLFLNHVWTMKHMGVLANGALALGTWGGMACRRPFTLEYAREHTDPALWNSPTFLRTNYLLTGMWAVVFTINAAIALQRSIQPVLPDLVYELVSHGLLILSMFISTWYPQHLARKRAAQQAG